MTLWKIDGTRGLLTFPSPPILKYVRNEGIFLEVHSSVVSILLFARHKMLSNVLPVVFFDRVMRECAFHSYTSIFDTQMLAVVDVNLSMMIRTNSVASPPHLITCYAINYPPTPNSTFLHCAIMPPIRVFSFP